MLADKLGTLSWFASAVDHGPWGAFAWVLVATWGIMNLLAIGAEWRILWPSQQYPSFYKGDSLGLTTIMAALVAMAKGMPEGHHWYQSGWWHWSWLGIGLTVGLGIAALEKIQGAYDWPTLLSPTKMYHNGFVFPVLIYLVAANGIPVLLYSANGPRGAVSGHLSGILPLVVGVAATVYYIRLLWHDITDPHAQDGKLAHVPLKPMEGLLVLGALASAGLAVLLNAGRHQSVTDWMVMLTVGGLSLYVTCFAKDMVKPAQLPWAHVPWRPSYLLGWTNKRHRPSWSWDTRNLAHPRDGPAVSV